MNENKICLSAIKELARHSFAVNSLLKKTSLKCNQKSRNRRLLIAYRDLKKAGIKVSWFSWSSFTIEKIDYTRKGMRIMIDSVNVPGCPCPIEYFIILPHFSSTQLQFPCCATPILLQKLVKYKLIPLSETVPAFERLKSVN